MHWSFDLQSPYAILSSDPNHPATLTLGPDEQGRTASVEIVEDEGYLIVSAVTNGVTEDGRRSVHPEWYNRANLCVMVEPPAAS